MVCPIFDKKKQEWLMPVFELDRKEVFFPPAYLADPSGLLAVGGDLSPDRLVAAYQQGIFPWFNPDEVPLWWSPHPRFVLFPPKLKVSKSMRQILRKGVFRVTFDQDFIGVLEGCQEVPRPGQEGGTWISKEVISSYFELFHRGYAHSVEVWEGEKLVGGLYGVALGKCFFGESMFAKAGNASKAGFITLVRNLEEQGYHLVDCQVYTKHLESLGAEMMPRMDFLRMVEESSQHPVVKEVWQDRFRTDFAF
jgi:leucyl/phenylalanyl-tRNA---protein transferase